MTFIHRVVPGLLVMVTAIAGCLLVPPLQAVMQDPLAAGIGARRALLIEAADGEQAHAAARALATVLQKRYGFETPIELYGPDASRDAIDDAMSRIYRQGVPGDELLVFLSMPLIQESRDAWLLPNGADMTAPWKWLSVEETVDWLEALPVNSVLLLMPGCPRKDAYLEQVFNRLGYRKSDAVFEVMYLCDLEALRLTRRGPEIVPTEQRRMAITTALAATLATTGATEQTTELSATELASRMSRRIGGLEAWVRRLPSYAERGFSFTAAASGVAEYELRYQQASSEKERSAVIASLIGAARDERSVLAADAVDFLARVALDPSAGLGPDTGDARSHLTMRSQAVRALGLLAVQQARDALASVVDGAQDSEYVRRAAVSELASQSGAGDAERAAVRTAMGDSDASVREVAIRAAATLGDRRSTQLLARMAAGDPSQEVRLAAVQSLAVLGDPTHIADMRALLDDADAVIRREAADALGRMTPSVEVTSALLRMLTSDVDPGAREAAAYAIGRNQSQAPRDSIVEALEVALAVGPDSVRTAVAFALGRLGGSDAEQELLSLLGRSEKEVVQVAAVDALGELRSESAAEILASLATHPSAGLRRAAVRALGQIGGSSAAPVLLNATRDENPHVRREAQRSLEKVQIESTVSSELFGNATLSVRVQTLKGLGTSEAEDSLDLLVGALGDESQEVRQAAIGKLVELEDDRTAARVIEALEARDARTRQAAVAVLGQWQRRDAINALLSHGNDPSAAVRAEIVRALQRNPGPATGYLMRAAGDSDSEVRIAAADALAALGSEAATKRLQALATADPSPAVRRAASAALRGAATSFRKR